jgi:hypothetical protein
MQPCDACLAMVGKPSSMPPHGDLAASDVSAGSSLGRMSKTRNSWNCTVCGNWLYQNTADGDPPNEWVMDKEPAARPDKK